ncbi:FliA/WhiG family RNA polymerase sigma factor [Oscillospiraceae bacterium OttesenSCG-928-G22]|nr:FliA/WhiG family RNA polymerase sigma factor [Oscillospiraceae bacterium OttesenSCG-928-G22]
MVENSSRTTDSIWRKFRATNDPELRRELISAYTGLVKKIVYRMIPTYKNHVEIDDMMSYGVLGLIDAVDKFDPDKNVKFETYASLRIKGEIIDQIRKLDWIPISLRQKIKKVEGTFTDLEFSLGRSPSEEEVASSLGIKVSEVQKTLDDAHMFNVVCLDDVMFDRLQNAHGGTVEQSPERNFEDNEMKEILAEEIKHLTEKEQLVISLYYFDELTLKEIGLTLGVSESRVSQIHSKALLSLRTRLKKAIGE